MKKIAPAVVATALLALTATACSSASSTPAASTGGGAAASSIPSSVPSATADAAIKAMVPAQIESSGVLNGGANFQAPPMAMYASGGKTPTGAVVQLVDHAAGLMGLTVNWQQVLYPDQIPAMQAGKIMVSGSATSASAAFIKTANVIGAFKNLQSIIATSANAGEFQTLADSCGKKIGLGEAAAATVTIFEGIQKYCTDNGKPAPTKVGLSATADIVLAVQSGRVDGGLLPTPTVVYTAQNSSGKLVATKASDQIVQQINEGIEGFTVAKDQPKLAAAFQAAINEMIKDGSYKSIMTSFGLPTSQLISSATLNEAS
jgi:polar amino acid transport system substrate-binding protein